MLHIEEHKKVHTRKKLESAKLMLFNVEKYCITFIWENSRNLGGSTSFPQEIYSNLQEGVAYAKK